MKARIQITVETEVGQQVQEIASWERHEHRLEDIGLTLAESKSLLAAIEKILVEQQITEYLEAQRDCPLCGKARGQRGSHTVTLQTLFGNLKIDSPRWSHCGCQPQETKTFSPVAELLSERVSAERLYLETKWASLVSFELTASLLKDTLPVAETVNATSIRNHLQGVAERVEAGLGKEHVSFIDGCPAEWAALPRPPAPLTVGIDGCYLRQWDDKKTHFEVIVGKSMSADGPSRCFGYTQTYDEKPKRRLFEMLRSQGMQMNQRVMFFSDGGADIREVQSYLNPEGEQYLDWFHVTMRITVLGQYAKGLDTAGENRDQVLRILESTIHYLWHGNVVRAHERIDDLQCYLDNENIQGESERKLKKALEELATYITANEGLIPNYGERWRNEEAIATGFVESAVNQIVSKRFAKRQQMQWTKKGAHLLLQTRTLVLDSRLEETFQKWYSGFRRLETGATERAA